MRLPGSGAVGENQQRVRRSGRRGGVQARVVTKETRQRAERSNDGGAPAAAKRKLSFNEQHDLKTLPARMVEIEAKMTKVQDILADPQLYARDPARFQKASEALATLQADLAAAEDRWLELEMLKEELEG